MKQNKLGMIVYIILLLGYGISTLVLSIIAIVKFEESTQDYFNMTNNFKEPYIVDIISGNSDCAAGYSSITYWDWKGISDGCDCHNNSNNEFHGLFDQSCNSTQINDGCADISGINAREFNFFGATELQKLNICIKRADDSQAFYKIAADQTGQCSLKQKTCGNTAKPDTVICVDPASPCPVYQIVLLQAPDTSTYPPSEWTPQILPSSGGYLYFNQKGTTSSTLPTSEIRFTQGNGIFPNGVTSDYYLANSLRESCSSTDISFLTMSISVPEKIYYQLNLSSTDFLAFQALPDNPAATSTEPFKAYRRPYINWKISERSKLKDFVDSEDNINELNIAQVVYVVVNVLVCFTIIILSILYILNLCGNNAPCMSGSGKRKEARMNTIKLILNISSKAAQIPFLLWAMILSTKKKDILRTVSDSAPSEEIYNKQIEILAKSVETNVFQNNLIAIIIFAIIISVDFIIIISYCISKNKRRYKFDENNDDVKQQPHQLQPSQTTQHFEVQETGMKHTFFNGLDKYQQHPIQGIQLQQLSFPQQYPQMQNNPGQQKQLEGYSNQEQQQNPQPEVQPLEVKQITRFEQESDYNQQPPFQAQQQKQIHLEIPPNPLL